MLNGTSVRPHLPLLFLDQRPSRYFNRDVECIRTFFKRRFRYDSALYPRFRKTLEESGEEAGFKLDVMVEASGFGRKEMKVLEEVIFLGIF